MRLNVRGLVRVQGNRGRYVTRQFHYLQADLAKIQSVATFRASSVRELGCVFTGTENRCGPMRLLLRIQFGSFG